jgi:hypothetical protein
MMLQPRKNSLPFHYVAFPIAHFVPFKVGTIYTPGLFGLFTDFGRWPFIAMLRMQAIIYVPVEPFGAMEPGSGANKCTAGKPLRPVVPCGSTSIRRSVIVSIGTLGRYADFDGDLGGGLGGNRHDPQSGNCGQ